jgi:cephalosporin hydroxylase
MKDDTKAFELQCEKKILEMVQDKQLRKESFDYMNAVSLYNYSYHFKWMGLPIIQYPQDIIAMQELIFALKPDFIIETGVARGGSLVFYSSMLELLGGDNNKKVIGVDIDIREHNRKRLESHPMYKNICLVEGSSIDSEVIAEIDRIISENNLKKGIVVLDSMHSHAHVLDELRLYNKYVEKDSYLVVFDTVVEYMPEDSFPDRPWGVGDNPMTAVEAFLKENDRFVIDEAIESKLLITVAPKGYLKCVK